ncbi:hypothetical protein [Anabaena azotica]|uniref:Uncharacterized protein n=1 Tax=Anabaena azotica FACHB-119 TaxID=947527 RepID=A0ABR8D8D9_9NOST|nr:hypothetical protein [Anabaena azotica]MBD2503430.1 hypothetical protein [Anabaena azotica FACHB-119]
MNRFVEIREHSAAKIVNTSDISAAFMDGGLLTLYLYGGQTLKFQGASAEKLWKIMSDSSYLIHSDENENTVTPLQEVLEDLDVKTRG